MVASESLGAHTALLVHACEEAALWARVTRGARAAARECDSLRKRELLRMRLRVLMRRALCAGRAVRIVDRCSSCWCSDLRVYLGCRRSARAVCLCGASTWFLIKDDVLIHVRDPCDVAWISRPTHLLKRCQTLKKDTVLTKHRFPPSNDRSVDTRSAIWHHTRATYILGDIHSTAQSVSSCEPQCCCRVPCAGGGARARRTVYTLAGAMLYAISRNADARHTRSKPCKYSDITYFTVRVDAFT